MAQLDLTLWEDTLPQNLTIDIMNIAKNKLNVPPSYPITLKHYESLWGSSSVAQQNKNWGGVTWNPSWSSPHTRPSGVVITRGTARPAIEGGHYVLFSSVADYFTDWAYFMSDKEGFYNVQNAPTFQLCVYGMFMVGGALGDYATMNVEGSGQRYALYYEQMVARRNAINDANGGILDRMDAGEFDDLIDAPPGPDPEPELDFSTVETFFNTFVTDFIKEIEKMFSAPLYNYGYKKEFGNGFVRVMTQLNNMYQMRTTSSFASSLQTKGDTAYAELTKLLEGIKPVKPVDPEPTPGTPFLPVSPNNVITSPWGWRTDPYEGFHSGLDFGALVPGVDGEPIYATMNGTIEVSEWSDSGLGNVVWINHTDDEYFSAYAHLSAFNKVVGDVVEQGDIIGFMGNTGLSTGTHLHLVISTKLWGYGEVETIDPQSYLGI